MIYTVVLSSIFIFFSLSLSLKINRHKFPLYVPRHPCISDSLHFFPNLSTSLVRTLLPWCLRPLFLRDPDQSYSMVPTTLPQCCRPFHLCLTDPYIPLLQIPMHRVPRRLPLFCKILMPNLQKQNALFLRPFQTSQNNPPRTVDTYTCSVLL